MNERSGRAEKVRDKLVILLEKQTNRFIDQQSKIVKLILLSPSLLFSKSTLYLDVPSLERESQNLCTFLDELSNNGLLKKFANGCVTKTRQATVFVKQIADDADAIKCDRLGRLYASYGDPQISRAAIMGATKQIHHTDFTLELKQYVKYFLLNNKFVRSSFGMSMLRDQGKFL
jgi:hypothetical protein